MCLATQGLEESYQKIRMAGLESQGKKVLQEANCGPSSAPEVLCLLSCFDPIHCEHVLSPLPQCAYSLSILCLQWVSPSFNLFSSKEASVLPGPGDGGSSP